MANTIKLKRASGSDPGNSDLSVGELAIRTSNCKLFSKNDGGSAVGIVAGSADTLTTARTIAGVSFDGSGNISLNNNAITNGAGYIANIVSDTSPQLGGDLDVQSNKITTATSNGNVKIEPNGTGVVEVRGAGGNEGKLQLTCSAQSHGIILASPAHSSGQSYTLIFPDNQIAADKYLKIKSISGSGSTAIGQAEYASLDANDLGEGTIPDARFPSTLPALNGSALTNLNGSSIASGTIAAARVATLNQDTTGNAATATALETARTIAGVSFDGTANISLNNNAITNGAGYITATLTQEQVEDFVGNMVQSNTETGITVTYQDSDGTLDFVVASQTDENFTTTLKNKLDGIESGATADQSASEIVALIADQTIAPSTIDMEDNEKILLGASDDLEIFHSGSHSIIKDGGTGNLNIQGSSIVMLNAAGTENLFKAVEDGAIELYFNNSKKLETDNDGISMSGDIALNSGTLFGNDNAQIRLGGSQDLNIFHDGTNSTIDSNTGTLIIRSDGGGFKLLSEGNIILRDNDDTTNLIRCINGGQIELYHNGSKKAETVSGGFTVTGTCTATAFSGDGSALTGISAGATGGGSDEIFYENGQNVTTDYTITNGKNAMSAGPITIDSGVTVTVGSGETLTIV